MISFTSPVEEKNYIDANFELLLKHNSNWMEFDVGSCSTNKSSAKKRFNNASHKLCSIFLFNNVLLPELKSRKDVLQYVLNHCNNAQKASNSPQHVQQQRSLRSKRGSTGSSSCMTPCDTAKKTVANTFSPTLMSPSSENSSIISGLRLLPESSMMSTGSTYSATAHFNDGMKGNGYGDLHLTTGCQAEESNVVCSIAPITKSSTRSHTAALKSKSRIPKYTSSTQAKGSKKKKGTTPSKKISSMPKPSSAKKIVTIAPRRKSLRTSHGGDVDISSKFPKPPTQYVIPILSLLYRDGYGRLDPTGGLGIDYYYVKPGCQMTGGIEGTDYFRGEASLLKYLDAENLYAQYLTELEGNKKMLRSYDEERLKLNGGPSSTIFNETSPEKNTIDETPEENTVNVQHDLILEDIDDDEDEEEEEEEEEVVEKEHEKEFEAADDEEEEEMSDNDEVMEEVKQVSKAFHASLPTSAKKKATTKRKSRQFDSPAATSASRPVSQRPRRRSGANTTSKFPKPATNYIIPIEPFLYAKGFERVPARGELENGYYYVKPNCEVNGGTEGVDFFYGEQSLLDFLESTGLYDECMIEYRKANKPSASSIMEMDNILCEEDTVVDTDAAEDDNPIIVVDDTIRSSSEEFEAAVVTAEENIQSTNLSTMANIENEVELTLDANVALSSSSHNYLDELLVDGETKQVVTELIEMTEKVVPQPAEEDIMMINIDEQVVENDTIQIAIQQAASEVFQE